MIAASTQQQQKKKQLQKYLLQATCAWYISEISFYFMWKFSE